jgi:hypothetical protein
VKSGVILVIQMKHFGTKSWLTSKYALDALGTIDHFMRPKLATGWGGPFNNQQGRQQIFRQLLRRLNFNAVVETGTYRGTTTQFLFEESKLPVYSVEAHARYFRHAWWRFRHVPSVSIRRGDSRWFLEALAHEDHVPMDRVFFYLDAHWDDDLPLHVEIDSIVQNWTRPVIMIDDFQVPGDIGYTFDDYGPKKRLCIDYLASSRARSLVPYFPTLPSGQESGSKRGCVVLVAQELRDEMGAVDLLREFNAVMVAGDSTIVIDHTITA